jgi:ribosomal-protein-alanine N-acetyltransferase
MTSSKSATPEQWVDRSDLLWGVRPLEEGDLDAILSIERASFPSPWSPQLFQEEMRNPLSRCWVALARSPGSPGEGQAREPGDVVGYLCVWMVSHEMHIMNLAVHPAHRRRRVARALVKRAFDEATALGVAQVFLEVRASNVAAQTLYGSLGFRPVGRRAGYYGDRGEDAIVMAHELGA